MEEEKRILNYFLVWIFFGFLICFVGITDVFAETHSVSEIKSQIRTIYTDGTTQWYTSNNGAYGSQLYFGSGPTYSTFGIPCNFRLLVVNDIDSDYSYKYNYAMTIYTPYSSNNTWDSTQIDRNYDLKVGDDAGIVKESKCSIVNTDIVNGNTGVYTTKEISCVFTVNKSYNNAYISAGYFCKGNCELNNMEPLGFIPQDSYMTITSPSFEKFVDNSNVIIDQNQTIIDQNNQTNEKLDDVEQSIIDSNKETQEVIKDQFNSCRDSYNLFDLNTWYNSLTSNNGSINLYKDSIEFIAISNSMTNIISSHNFKLKPSTTYTLSFNAIVENNVQGNTWLNLGLEAIDNVSYGTLYINSNGYFTKTFTTNQNGDFYLKGYVNADLNNNNKVKLNLSNIMLNEGSSAKTYEKYGKICSNKLDEAEETRKGIWQTIKDLPNAFMNMLKGLFIPEDNYFENWFNELKIFFENKLGFLATPFSIIIDFINRYLELNPKEDIIINIPDISVPNFEDHIIIKATSLNWSQLLKSKESLNTLWQLYLSFIDVFIILNFINLCENKYNRIFGGDTTQYEYYTVEDSYNVDINTGEVKNMRRNERKTTRKKVN